jgi:hypothetical protein
MNVQISGYTIAIGAIILAAAALQWLVIATASALSRAPKVKSGLRAAEKRLLVSSGVLAAAWLAVFGMNVMPRSRANVAAATAVTPHGSCSSVTTDMPEDEVRAKAGKPDEIRKDEEARGPGAAIWIYRDSRCAVHLFDGKVEFVE